MIKFGTSGWRAVFSRDFTFANIRRLAHAVSQHVKENPEFGALSPEFKAQGGAGPVVVVGYDTRFLSEDFAREAAEVFAADGLKVLLSKSDIPTPAVSHGVIQSKAVGGVTITASHNPAQYNGFKWTPYWGGPAPQPVTDDIERRCPSESQHVRTMPLEKARNQGLLEIVDFKPSYLKKLLSTVDSKAIKRSGLKVGVDCMHGAGRGWLPQALEQLGLEPLVLNADRDVLFEGRPPEPSPESLGTLIELMKKKNLDLGLACDGDADRFGILDKGGLWISANDVLALLLHHLTEHKGMTGKAARSVMTSRFMDAVAKSKGLETRETPVGFKHLGELLRRGEYILAGEESGGLSIRGHVPEKDGILACLLVLELVAMEKKPLAKIREMLFKKVGSFLNERLNFRLEHPRQVRQLQERLQIRPPLAVAGSSVWRIDQADGFKFLMRDGSWLGLRGSGTEPVIRIYAEASNPEKLRDLIQAGKKILQGKF